MAANDDSLTLMGIPLEIRHQIFAMASVRDKGTKKVLRRWYEKADVKKQVAKVLQANPDLPAPRVVYDDDEDEEDVVPDLVAEEQDEDEEENEENAEEEDEENAEENEDESESEDDEAQEEGPEEDELEDEDAEEEMIEGETEENEMETEETGESLTVGHDAPVTNDPDAMHGVAQGNVNGTAQAEVDEDEDMSDDVEAGDGQNGEDAEDDEGNEEGADESTGDDETAANGDGNDRTTAQTSPPRPVVVKPERKWRHIPKFLRISGCPPPPELLLACKEMSREVKDWFYDVTVIRIDVSGSFAHTSMFEEALLQLAESELSPFRNIRKVELMFVWDTEWIRSEEFARAIFPALLMKRVEHVQQLLQVCATELRHVTVHWHDSINDNESAVLKCEVLDHLDALPANIKVEEHYLPPGQKPRAKTIAGKKRLEFQAIADSSYHLL